MVKGQLDDIDTTLVTRPPQATLFSQLPGNDPSRPLERKPLKRHLADLIEKPPGKGPFTCRICFAIFSGWTGLVNKQLISVWSFTYIASPKPCKSTCTMNKFPKSSRTYGDVEDLVRLGIKGIQVEIPNIFACPTGHSVRKLVCDQSFGWAQATSGTSAITLRTTEDTVVPSARTLSMTRGTSGFTWHRMPLTAWSVQNVEWSSGGVLHSKLTCKVGLSTVTPLRHPLSHFKPSPWFQKDEIYFYSRFYSGHMVDDDLSCPECDRSFDNEVRLEIHMESQHRTVAKIESEPETKVDVANSSLLLFPTGKLTLKVYFIQHF